MTVWPRDEENRFRLYVLSGGELRCLASGPDGASIGTALVTLHEDGEWTEADRVGVLDTHASEEGPGTWIVSPYA